MNKIKIGRKQSNKKSLVRNLVTSLILYESIKTTKAKSKLVKQQINYLISKTKKADLNAVKKSNSYLFDKNASKKLIHELIPRYKERSSGFVKTYNFLNRKGDNAEIVILELIDKKKFINPKTDDKDKNKDNSK